MSWIRLCITAEGQTEEKFVNQILAPHLVRFNIETRVRCVLTSRKKRKHYDYRGGLLDYDKAKNDILRWMKEDSNPECRFSTMFDLYALPVNFPDYENTHSCNDPYKKVKKLEEAFQKNINDHRFIPYIQLHEFETLIFADLPKMECEYIDYQKQISNLIKVVQQEDNNPELINDGEETAPSKRILKLIPEYDKSNAGPIIVEKIGMETLRNQCRHFNEWIQKLENLSKTQII